MPAFLFLPQIQIPIPAFDTIRFEISVHRPRFSFSYFLEICIWAIHSERIRDHTGVGKLEICL
jgi:hypothetical protein